MCDVYFAFELVSRTKDLFLNFSLFKLTCCFVIASQFEKEALHTHNRYRAIHNAPAMTLNCEMNQNAAAYAQKLADMDSLVQSSYNERPEQGENLSLGCYVNREQTAEEVVKTWYVPNKENKHA